MSTEPQDTMDDVLLFFIFLGVMVALSALAWFLGNLELRNKDNDDTD